MKGLIIRQPHIGKILDGEKTWEMRSGPTKIRGRIALIEAGSGLIVGEASIVDCIKPYLDTYIDKWKHASKHRVSVENFHKLDRWCWAWVLSDAIKYDKPIPYDHPKGAVIWVNLELEAKTP